jgi:hypothetical protein
MMYKTEANMQNTPAIIHPIVPKMTEAIAKMIFGDCI